MPEPTLRPGQRVRLTIEGTVYEKAPGYFALRNDEGLGLWLWGDGPDRSLMLQAATVEVLVEPPRPDEPTGLGAVVRDGEGRLHVRGPDRTFLPWLRGASTWYAWAELPDPITVLSPGIDPEAAR